MNMNRPRPGLAAVLVAAVVWFGCGVNSAPTAAPMPLAQDTSPETQAKRLALIQELIDRGIVHNIEVPGYLPRVRVGLAFYALSYDARGDFANLILAYYNTENPEITLVIFEDYATHKKVGEYSVEFGGEWTR